MFFFPPSSIHLPAWCKAGLWLPPTRPGHVAMCCVLTPFCCWKDYETFALLSLHLGHHIYCLEYHWGLLVHWCPTEDREPWGEGTIVFIELFSFSPVFSGVSTFSIFVDSYLFFLIFCLLLSRDYFAVNLFLGYKWRLWPGSLTDFSCRHLLFYISLKPFFHLCMTDSFSES